MTTTTRMDMLVNARNQASATLKEVRGDLDQLNNTARMVSAGFTGMVAAIGVDSVVNLGRAVFDLARESQGVEALRSSFDNLAQSIGTSGPALLAALEGVSQGMISQQDLILSANRAVVLGVTSSQQEMEQLMQVAITRGRAMGLSATQAFNDLVTGLGRMSPLILDNLGIVTGGEKVFKDYAESVGKSADALSDAEKKQALFNKVLAESQEMLAQGIQANPFAQMDAQIANVRVKLGGLFAGAAGEFAQAVADAAGNLSSYFDQADTAGMESVGSKLGYAIGLGIKDSIVAALTGDGIDWTPLGWNLGVELGKGTRQALIDTGGEIGAALNDAITPDTLDAEAALLRTKELYDELAVAQAAYNDAVDRGSVNDMLFQSDAIAAAKEDIAALAGAAAQAVAAMRPLNKTVADNAAAAWDAVGGWKTFGGATAAAGAAQTTAAPAVADMTEQLKEQGRAAAAAAGQLQGMYMAAVSALGAAQALAGFQSAQGELKGMEDMWVRQGRDPAEIPFLRQEWMNQEQSRLQWQIEAPQRAAEAQAALNAKWAENAQLVRKNEAGVRSWGETVKNAQRDADQGAKKNILPTTRIPLDTGGGGGGGGGGDSEAEQMYNDLRGRVQGILGNALNVDVGVNPDNFLPREDAINEDARRLADVMVRGFESPWYEFLNDKFPGMFEGAGDIKEKAAQIMRDFQAGLHPELIDKDQVKEQVKRMILGEASMSALADEIASELSGELGVSLAKAQEAVGAVMGIQSGDTTSAGTAIADGFADATNGEQMVKGMVERMEAAYNQLYQSGVKAGAQWGTGFMSVAQTGVAVPLIQLLATLVTPAVLAAIANGGSRTGAE